MPPIVIGLCEHGYNDFTFNEKNKICFIFGLK